MTTPPPVHAIPLSWPVVLITGVVCLLLGGFFSGSETGVMSLSRARVHRLRRRNPRSRAATMLDGMQAKVEDTVLSCLIGTNLANVVFSALVTMAVTQRLGPDKEWVAVILVSVLVVLFAEILPKVLFREYPERLMLAAAVPLAAAKALLWPVRKLLGLYSHLWALILGGGGHTRGFDRISLAALLLSYDVPGGHEERFAKLVDRFLKLAGRDLADIMRPVDRLTVIAPGTTVAACLELAAASGFSRLPVRHSDGVDPAGYVLVRDLLFLPLSEHDRPVPPDLHHELVMVDGRMSPYELFEELRSRGDQLAMVMGPRGRVRGMITLEDLIEAVVGSISDEFDPRREAKEAS